MLILKALLILFLIIQDHSSASPVMEEVIFYTVNTKLCFRFIHHYHHHLHYVPHKHSLIKVLIPRPVRGMKRLVTLADKGMMMGLGKRGMIGEKGMMMGLGKRGVIGDRGI